MTKPHKWAKEIIHWANGGEVERFNSDLIEWRIDTTPLWNNTSEEFRIKPQPKEKKFIYVLQDYTGRILIHEYKEYVGFHYLGKIEVQDD